MFNLHAQYQELNSLRADLRAVKTELRQAKRYYETHPEDHTPTFNGETLAPIYVDLVDDLYDRIDARYKRVNSELSKRKYKLFKVK